jgi:hypothetical protein
MGEVSKHRLFSGNSLFAFFLLGVGKVGYGQNLFSLLIA